LNTSSYRLPLVLLLLLAATEGRAQLVEPSLAVGAAVPVGGEADALGAGLHVGAALKLPIVPLQLEVGFDRMGASETHGHDLKVLSAGAAIPMSLTPPLSPLGIYLVAGGALHRHELGSDPVETDPGVSGGAGLKLGLGLSLYAEGRGVVVFADGNRITYVTVGGGLRF